MDDYECPLCMEEYAGRIFQCETGHSFCETCRNSMNMCPYCNRKVSNTRNFGLEQIMEKLKLKTNADCPNDGCTYKLTSATTKAAHASECKFKVQSCPQPGCHWVGEFNGLLPHFQLVHPHLCMESIAKNYTLQCNFTAVDKTYVLSYLSGRQLFYLRHKVDEVSQKMFWLFQFIGPQTEAQHYTFEFEINKGADKYKINGLCSSFAVDFRSRFAQEKCVAISFQQVRNFMADGAIRIRFRVDSIRKEDKFAAVQGAINVANNMQNRGFRGRGRGGYRGK